MISDRENRFLKALGITPGPWHLDDDTPGHTTVLRFDLTAPSVKHQSHEDANLSSKAPEMFLFMFRKLCGSISFIDLDMMQEQDQIEWKEDSKIIESAAGKPWTEIVEIWEGLE